MGGSPSKDEESSKSTTVEENLFQIHGPTLGMTGGFTIIALIGLALCICVAYLFWKKRDRPREAQGNPGAVPIPGYPGYPYPGYPGFPLHLLPFNPALPIHAGRRHQQDNDEV